MRADHLLSLIAALAPLSAGILACAPRHRPEAVRAEPPPAAPAPLPPAAPQPPPLLEWVRWTPLATPMPAPLPVVDIVSPVADGEVAHEAAPTTPVVLTARNWTLEDGRGLQVGLDDFRPRVVRADDQKLTLRDLVPADRPLALGEHLLWAVAVLPSGEAVKAPALGTASGAPAVLRRFWIGPKGAPRIDLAAPRLLYSQPRGTYNGEAAADAVLLDVYLFNIDPGAPPTLLATVEDRFGRQSRKALGAWQAYGLGSAPSGDYDVTVELGTGREGEAHRVMRTITVNREVEVKSR